MVNNRRGFGDFEGFSFGLQNSPAQLIPHIGLIPSIIPTRNAADQNEMSPTITYLQDHLSEDPDYSEYLLAGMSMMSDAQTPPEQEPTSPGTHPGVYPEEEILHNLTLSRNPKLLASTIIHHWNDTEPLLIEHWRPFFEASADVFASNVEEVSHGLNSRYKAEFERELSESGYRVTNERQNSVEELRGLLEDVIIGLAEFDIVPEIPFWTEENVQRLTVAEDPAKLYAHTLVETQIPAVFHEAISDVEDLSPEDSHRILKTTLSAWVSSLDDGEIPFESSLNEVWKEMYYQWAEAILKTLDELGQLLLRDEYETRLASTLSSLMLLFNPFIASNWLLPSTSAAPHVPLLMISTKTPSGTAAGLTDFAPIYSPVDAMRTELAAMFYEDCYIYDIGESHLLQWMGSALGFKESSLQFPAVQMANQIKDFLNQIELLYRHDGDFDCGHCSAFKGLLDQYARETNSYLEYFLEHRTFGRLGFKLVDAAFEFPDWVWSNLAETCAQHPLLNEDDIEQDFEVDMSVLLSRLEYPELFITKQ